MTNPAAHTLLDQLLNEVKQNLVDDHIDKMKTDILNVVAKKQENFLQDMVQICCPSTEANMYHYKMTATYRASIHSFMKKDPKREKHDSK